MREEKKPTSKETPTDDPYDFSNLELDIAATIKHLRHDLSKLRAGGRFNPEVLENLRVQPDKNSNQTVKLSDLAQVIPKGRTVQVMVGEEDVCIPYPKLPCRMQHTDPEDVNSTSNPSPQPSNPAPSP